MISVTNAIRGRTTSLAKRSCNVATVTGLKSDHHEHI